LSRRPPDVPASVPPNADITPVDDDIRLLEQQYNVRYLTVSKNSNIQQTVRRVLDILQLESEAVASQTTATVKEKPSAVSVSAEDEAPANFASPSPVRLVALSARAPAANKMISVVEIAKRELSDGKTKTAAGWYHYTSARSRVEQVKEQNETRSRGSREASKAVDGAVKDGAERRLNGSKEDVVQDEKVNKEPEDRNKIDIGVEKQSNGKQRATCCRSVARKRAAKRDQMLRTTKKPSKP